MLKNVAAVLLGACLLITARHAPAAECKLSLLGSATMAVSPNGALFLPVKIGEHEVWMALDLSSSVAMLSPEGAKHLGLKSSRLNARTRFFVGAERIEEETRVDQLVIAGVNFTNWNFFIRPQGRAQVPLMAGRPIVGTISARFINNVDMELDLSHNKMNLLRQSDCGGEQVYWTRQFVTAPLHSDDTGLLQFGVELDNKRVMAALRTSGPQTTLSESIAREHFRFRREAGVTSSPERGSFRVVGTRTMDLTARELSLPAVSVDVFDDQFRNCEMGRAPMETSAIAFTSCPGTVPLQIGTTLLKQLRFYFATGEKKVYISRAGPADPAAAAGSPPQ